MRIRKSNTTWDDKLCDVLTMFFDKIRLSEQGLELANAAFCQYFQGSYMDLNRKIKFVMRLIELYRPYLFFKGV